MTSEQAHDAAWADFELMAASDGLRSAVERSIRALASVARAGIPIETSCQRTISMLRDAEQRVRCIPFGSPQPQVRTSDDAKLCGGLT